MSSRMIRQKVAQFHGLAGQGLNEVHHSPLSVTSLSLASHDRLSRRCQ
jgi:hypothetical protein